MARTSTKGLLAAAAGLSLALAVTAAAAHGGGGMGGQSGMHGNFGGNSASHMSAQGLAHTNGPNAADRDFGRDRAEDVRNSHAGQHSMAGMHTGHTRTTVRSHATVHTTAHLPTRPSTDRVTSI